MKYWRFRRGPVIIKEVDDDVSISVRTSEISCVSAKFDPSEPSFDQKNNVLGIFQKLYDTFFRQCMTIAALENSLLLSFYNKSQNNQLYIPLQSKNRQSFFDIIPRQTTLLICVPHKHTLQLPVNSLKLLQFKLLPLYQKSTLFHSLLSANAFTLVTWPTWTAQLRTTNSYTIRAH